MIGMELTVTLGSRSYPIILLEQGISASLPIRLKREFPKSKFGLVTNTVIRSLYGKLIDSWYNELDLIVHCMPDGERYKTLETWGKIFDTFIPAKLERSSVIVALGGGVVGDMAGFAAATYMRGIACVQVPTTLLAMVDASVGGKTALDHAAGKNLIGAFHQPSLVWIDTAFLDTLPKREYAAGCAELFKYGFIGGPELFEYISVHGQSILDGRPEALFDGIRRGITVKAGVVERDEHETRGERMLLNFGHTFAHALEKYFDFKRLLHGEAVWWGMRCACELGKRLATIPEDSLDRYEAIMKTFPRPPLPPVGTDELIAAMRFDKKIFSGMFTFVIPAAPGFSIVKDDVPLSEVRQAIEAGLTAL
jgi:3-dehydroquinate synthase